MNYSEAGKKGYEKTKHQLDAHRQAKREKAIERYDSKPKYCPTCDERLPYEKRRNKFCSQSCAATYNNQGVVRVVTVKPKECAYCGTIKETRQNKYCDACIKNSVYNIVHNVEDILSEKGIRAHLLRTREHRCEDCGLDTWNEQVIPLEVDHIDGNPDHNTEENLRFLCPNCHALTDNFKAKARITGKKGRYSRRRIQKRKRYSEDKSW